MTMRRFPIRDLLSGSDAGNWGSEPESGSSCGVIRSGNIRDDGGLDLSDLVYRSYPADKAARLQLRAGDILLERSGGSDDRPVGRVAYVQGDTDLCFTNFLHRFRANQELVEPEYLFYLLFNMHQTRTTIALQTQTTGIRNLMFQRYLAYELQVPELSRQRHALTVLSRISAVLAAVEGIATAKRAFKRALMNDLLTGRRRFPEFEGRPWETRRLGDLFAERNETGFADLPLLSVTADLGIIPREEVGRKDTSNADKSKYKRVIVGDIAYNTMRMWQGVSALSALEGIVSPAYTVVTARGPLRADYAKHLFKLPRQVHEFLRRSQGLVDDTLNLKYPSFARVTVSFPENLEEQGAIVDVLDRVDQETELLAEYMNQVSDLKRGLMQRLLSGEIKIPEHLTAASGAVGGNNDNS